MDMKTQLSNLIYMTSRLLSTGFRLIVPLSLATFLLICFVLPVAAQSPDARVKFFLEAPDDKALTVGDHLTLRLEVSHPLDSRVVLPELGEQWGPFEVVGQTEPEIVDNNDGSATTGKDIVVTIFEPGEFQTPSLVVTHRLADGSVEELGAPVVQLNVTTVLTDDTDLRDLKPQAELPLPPIWPWVVGTILLTMFVLGLLAGLGLWLFDRRRKRAALELAPAPFVDLRPPEVIAYTELDRIEALNLPAHNQIKEHYSLVDLCLRRYIEGRYEIPALEQTSAEARAAFRRSPVLAEDAAEFMDIFSESDLVKFARYVPQVDNVKGLINRARAVVTKTTPVVEPVQELTTPEAELMP